MHTLQITLLCIYNIKLHTFMFGWNIFQQIFGIHMGTNCSPLLVDLVFEINETSKEDSLISYLDIYLIFDRNGQLSTNFMGKDTA